MFNKKITEIKEKLKNFNADNEKEINEKITMLRWDIDYLQEEIAEKENEILELENGCTEEKNKLEHDLLHLEVCSGKYSNLFPESELDKQIILASLFTNNFKFQECPNIALSSVYVTDTEVIGCNGYIATFIDTENVGDRENTVNSIKLDNKKSRFIINSLPLDKANESVSHFKDRFYEMRANVTSGSTKSKILKKKDILSMTVSENEDTLSIKFDNTKIYLNKMFFSTAMLLLNKYDDIEVLSGKELDAVAFKQKNIWVAVLPIRWN
ncbi:hypothetical protein [Wukongibacter sp. M2B1]|uniref:hypothetical protein n=1 Tax=Wukongibacter sp. M2B1 TaxID=3088895 RepID=UPI003D7B8EF4